MSSRVDSVQSAVLLGCLLLPGCMTSALWRDDQEQVLTARDHGEMAIETVGYVDDQRPGSSVDAPSVLVRARPARGAPEFLGGKSTKPVWMLFQPREERAASAIAALLACESLGPVDRCTIELDLTHSSPFDEYYLTAHVEIGGRLSPRICSGMLDEGTAAQLLGSPRAVEVPRLAAGRWSACVAAAERVDWHVLLQFAPDGHGVVIGGIDDGDGMELLVRVGRGADAQYLRVPADVTPLLSCVQRDWSSLWGERFLLQTGGNVKVLLRPMSAAAMGPPRRPVAMVFTSTANEMQPRFSLVEKILLTPLTALIDTLSWVGQHGPLAPLWGNDIPFARPRRPGH
jgi:hypothetical protein